MTNSERIPWKRLTAEGAAIVVSILLAFWIDAWWEDREQTQQLIGNLQALEEEMENNQREFSRSLDLIAGFFEKMDSVFETLADQDPEALTDEFLIDVGRSYLIQLVNVTNSAYDVVVSPENLRLVGNAEFRSSLIEARKAFLHIDLNEQVLWSEYTDKQGPFLASSGLINELGWPERQEAEFQSGFLRPLRSPPFARDTSALFTGEFWFLYEHWRMTYFDFVAAVIRAREAEERALELLRNELAQLTGTPSE
ncbi:MAG: hypothetical protein OEM63_13655 [Gammaproteobacteria bacterium]|nr:hypothetical protein [Gammaproteobacteria bacterium]